MNRTYIQVNSFVNNKLTIFNIILNSNNKLFDAKKKWILIFKKK